MFQNYGGMNFHRIVYSDHCSAILCLRGTFDAVIAKIAPVLYHSAIFVGLQWDYRKKLGENASFGKEMAKEV